MKYIEIIQELQQKEPNKIILVKCGAFFVALGKDAIMLNKLLKLKITCQKNNLCKVGIPVTAIMKYVDLMEKEGYSFSIYDYTKNNSQIAKVYNFVGKDNTEKFSIGNEYKSSMYQTLENILYIQKLEKSRKLYYLNSIDAKINCQRIYLRIMKNNRWIDEKKYKIAFELLLEIGRILGGLIKYYAKDTKK